MFFLFFCVCVGGECHCSKPQLSSKIGATSLVKEEHQGWHDFRIMLSYILLQRFDDLFACRISLLEIEVGELC